MITKLMEVESEPPSISNLKVVQYPVRCNPDTPKRILWNINRDMDRKQTAQMVVLVSNISSYRCLTLHCR